MKRNEALKEAAKTLMQIEDWEDKHPRVLFLKCVENRGLMGKPLSPEVAVDVTMLFTAMNALYSKPPRFFSSLDGGCDCPECGDDGDYVAVESVDEARQKMLDMGLSEEQVDNIISEIDERIEEMKEERKKKDKKESKPPSMYL